MQPLLVKRGKSPAERSESVRPMTGPAGIKRFALLLTLALVASGPARSAAQGAATIRGAVYYCEDRAAAPHAYVLLRNLDDGETHRFVTDEHGRFSRVGIVPGRYLITAQLVPSPKYRRDMPSRLARIETDDVLDMTIGVSHYVAFAIDFLGEGPPGPPNQPHPLCDPPVVPPAPPTSDRYIMH